MALTRRHRGLVARRHRSWRRATQTYKTGRAAGREHHIFSHFKTSSKLLDSKIRVGSLRIPRYGVQLIRFVYWVVFFRLLVFIVAHNIYNIINMMSIFYLIVCVNLL
jgi:hypothetical protein